MKKLLANVPAGSYVIQDNLYNFERLFEWATERGFYLCGTMRKNRISSPQLYDWLIDLPEKHKWKTAVRPLE